MKLDYEIVRHVLLSIENNDFDRMGVEDLCTDEYDAKIISYHISLLLDVGYIEAKPLRYLGSEYPDYIIKRMTMQGHQYLDSVRDNKVWEETKKVITKATSSITLDLIKSAALKIAMSFLGL